MCSWMHMCSANGESIPLILLISIKNMKQNEYHVAKVPGLSHSIHAGSYVILPSVNSELGMKHFSLGLLKILLFQTLIWLENTISLMQYV